MSIERLSAYILVSEEDFVDAGYPAPPGYAERQAKRDAMVAEWRAHQVAVMRRGRRSGPGLRLGRK